MTQKIHFLGIGGSGASAAAALAKAYGFEVTGCDKDINNEFTTPFEKEQLFKEHSPEHLKGVDILAITPAITSLDANNPELEEAKKKGIPVLTWQQFVGEYLMKERFVIAVCGTHGKTTTTAMISKILEDANLDPTVLLGAVHPTWKTNFRVGNSKYFTAKQEDSKGIFIIEADEFNDNFLSYKPNITVVTNIEMDHPEYFADLNVLLDSYEKFFTQTTDTIVANLEDQNIAVLIKDVMKQSSVTALDFNKIETEFDLKVPGKYNVLNAKAALQVGLLLGIESGIIKQSLNNYTGVGRRFEFIGEYNGAQIYSDFGHHPTEIKVTIEAARERFEGKKLWLIYQPHMFSRTKALFNDFVKVFKELPVNRGVILDIYPSREVDTGLITSQQLVEAIGKENVTYSTWEDLKKDLQSSAKIGDILFFMGAGDTDKFARQLLEN